MAPIVMLGKIIPMKGVSVTKKEHSRKIINRFSHVSSSGLLEVQNNEPYVNIIYSVEYRLIVTQLADLPLTAFSWYLSFREAVKLYRMI